ncbi:MAG TPA: CHAD domain-containing protein [Candidatus Aquilonibacter sp.]|nr:CHAD domain-containing protein [Candidatus Aquilonibacter sp.]
MIATPVCKLREQAKRLEASLSVGVATPTVKAVHELRSATRRVEAQLELLGMMDGLPAYHPEAAKVLRRLESLRKRAGKVRDCDVHLKLLQDKDREMRSMPETTPDLIKSRDKLHKRLTKRRARKEQRLIAAIEKQLPKLARDTEALLKALKPAEDRQASVAEMLRLIDHKFDRNLSSRQTGEEHLHDLRKAAKRARYQCEGLPGPQAAALARRLEDLQDAGGSWHDLLDLAKSCHDTLGSDHPMSRLLEHLRDERLDDYLANLDDLRQKRPHRRAAPAQKKAQQKSSSSAQHSTPRRTAKNSSRSRS